MPGISFVLPQVMVYESRWSKTVPVDDRLVAKRLAAMTSFLA